MEQEILVILKDEETLEELHMWRENNQSIITALLSVGGITTNYGTYEVIDTLLKIESIDSKNMSKLTILVKKHY